MIVEILLPLWVVLAMLGTSLGLTPDQVSGKNVYISTEQIVSSGNPNMFLTGMACDRQLFPDGGAGWLDARCGDMPDGTVIVYWPSVDPAVYGPGYSLYVLRHEIEHLLRGRDGPSNDVNNEAGARAAGCAAAPGWWCGG